MFRIDICDIFPGLVPEIEYFKNVFTWCLQVGDLLEFYHVMRTKHFLTISRPPQNKEVY